MYESITNGGLVGPGRCIVMMTCMNDVLWTLENWTRLATMQTRVLKIYTYTCWSVLLLLYFKAFGKNVWVICWNPKGNMAFIEPMYCDKSNITYISISFRVDWLAVRQSIWLLCFSRCMPIQSTLAQVMAWCLTASIHYLNQCWFSGTQFLHCNKHKKTCVACLIPGISFTNRDYLRLGHG